MSNEFFDSRTIVFHLTVGLELDLGYASEARVYNADEEHKRSLVLVDSICGQNPGPINLCASPSTDMLNLV